MNSLYDATNRYWSKTELSPLPPAVCALYYILCYLANRQRWQMPVRCSTAMLAYHLHISKQRVCTARKTLCELGFIHFIDGTNQSAPAEYVILDSPKMLTQKFTPDVTPQLMQELTHYKEEKNKEESSHTTREKMLSLIDLEEKFVADTDWHQSVFTFIESSTHLTLISQQLQDWIHQFFQYLSAKGMKEREEEDTRAYFCSWLKLQLTPNKRNSYATNNPPISSAANRRPVDINASEKKNYKSSF
ncbi:MAG: hypothetical protein KHX42_07615 [Prevotella sp.]|nr:hypothetical protein [Prevotella sp.]